MATDNVKLEINIAGEPIQLTVPYQKKDSVSNTAKAINDLYSEWRVKFSRKTPQELLAMIAYQYASFYYELSERYDYISRELSEISVRLDLLTSPEENV